MATYIELQTQVNRRVIDLPTAVQAEVPDLVNKAVRAIQRGYNYKVMQGVLTATTNSGAGDGGRSLLAVPSTFKEFRGRPFVRNNAGSVRDLTTSYSRNGVEQEFGVSTTTSIGRPEIILHGEPSDEAGAAAFEVWPLPDGASDYVDKEYRVVIPVWQYLTTLAADGDTNWFTVNGDYAIVYMATAEAFALNWDPENEALWRARGVAEERELRKLDKRQRLAGTTTLAYSLGAKAPNVRRL